MIIMGTVPYNGMLTMIGEMCAYIQPSLTYANDNTLTVTLDWPSENVGDFFDRCDRITNGHDEWTLEAQYEYDLWKKDEL